MMMINDHCPSGGAHWRIQKLEKGEHGEHRGPNREGLSPPPLFSWIQGHSGGAKGGEAGGHAPHLRLPPLWSPYLSFTDMKQNAVYA